LLPILQKLKSTNNAKPFEVMIIVPSRELGMQVFDEIQYLGYSSKESMLLVAGNESVDDQLKLVNENKPQVVVGSASRLLEILQKNKRLLQHVKTVVIDEADKVFQPLSAYASAKQKYNRIVSISSL
jgi:ATP-dependent RNA helicase DeaD